MPRFLGLDPIQLMILLGGFTLLGVIIIEVWKWRR